ncbi:anaerobic ribonucleoside-triphosphate reductase [candidate division WOR-1 bacterium RIFOXYA12_FULL_43_27]|uniref:Anaerobic ribonucleoside-triphosphate reductase n=1 Tax=candidate division WOR-1 bacterium RIFOXYC2_FULL_46_14 TaxID=1802587 RepID=A0A1F4U6J0_UNCSA|nr:MAG: anaerobic ribonucleoside-triphosphate reductase [candidate division WOR-1 bacterium RIFOXYA12_FULL_43_27]OGC20757.1 MAG: anaerobic ribonucleoside-triphosphate reductase [candidate division WOR-1 bacterium RIFOXYB2_FULL_46_45]OGC31506.1 MAG: anaerobic ribonucleoside-triphosphate reductase [candidate division WOR-1 bacterium RIFOXYA2_FULL_46_56]OGC39913.1 MAG: anaerobic ribonucleoside-triphosphate reductase [candidate division WOR-1 bacterium RIFOXYC2_FULL_46_14]
MNPVAVLPEKAPVEAREDDSTDLSLFVRTSSENIVGWDREKIVSALVRETSLTRDIAEIIGHEVERQIQAMRIKGITSPLIRELVDVKLLEYGLEEARRRHTRLGTPLYDVKEIILNQNKENANVPHGPEATNLTLAENIKKEFALLHVFTPDIADAHMRGDLHLHDLGFIDRPYCSGQSVEYVKKFGLDLPNALSIAKPAKHADVLLAQMVKFSAALQGVFAGAIGWDAVNVFFAPFLVGMSDKDVKQVAQMMIYEYSQQAVARGGQAIFSDINLYWEMPKHFASVPAIGPGGQYTGKVYSDYIKESQKFVWALFDVYRDGDGSGRPFFFPKPLVHMTERFFQAEGHEKFLRHISEVASVMGNTYFVFDRGDTAKISECCRLSFKLEQSDLDDAREPWRMRYSALQNVTVNLPRLAFRAAGDDQKFFTLLSGALEMVAKAHIQKKKFIEEILAQGANGPLSMLAMKRDGQPYLRMWRVSYLVGILGLNEVVQFHLGKELHESREALKFGLKVISMMKIKCEELTKKHGMHFVLEQTPAESTAYRFAKLDLQNFKKEAQAVVKGNLSSNEIYYTNSTYFNVSNRMNPVDRVKQEGLFHPLIDAGALTHVWMGESRPDPESIANFVIKTMRQTDNAQVAFSPEFTSCNDCSKIVRGLRSTCPSCSSENIEGITRITGYFSKINGWNKGKSGELKDRFRTGGLLSAN